MSGVKLLLFGVLVFLGNCFLLSQFESIYDRLWVTEYYKNFVHVGINSLIFPAVLVLILRFKRLAWLGILILMLYWGVLIVNSLYFSYFGGLAGLGLMERVSVAPQIMWQVIRQLWSWSETVLFLLAVSTVGIAYSLSGDARFRELRIKVGKTFSLSVPVICIVMILIGGLRFLIQYRSTPYAYVKGRDSIQAVKRYGWTFYYGQSFWSENLKQTSPIPFPGKISEVNKHSSFEDAHPKNLNVIILQVESLDAKLMDFNVGGEYFLTALNALKSESIYFEHFFAQHQGGGSQDAELSTLYSVLPRNDYPGFVRLSFSNLKSLADVLGDSGYKTVAMHGNQGSFFNRKMVLLASGFDRMYDEEDYTGDAQGWYSKDIDFLEQSIRKMSALETPFLSYLITMQSHGPFENYTALSAGVDAGATVLENNYFRSMKEVDSAVGYFVEALKSTGLFNTSILIVFGDHASGVVYDVKGYEYDKAIYPDHVPFMIHYPDCSPEVVSEVVSNIDIGPTILELLQIEEPPLWLGSSMFANGSRHVVLNRGQAVRIKWDKTKLMREEPDDLDLKAISWSHFIQSN